MLQGKANFAPLRGLSYSTQSLIAAPNTLRKAVEKFHFRNKNAAINRKSYFAPLPGVRYSTLGRTSTPSRYSKDRPNCISFRKFFYI